MYKKHKVVILPTEVISNIVKFSDGVIQYFENLKGSVHSSGRFQHLYIISDEDYIKGGDWFISYETGVPELFKSVTGVIYLSGIKDKVFKVIASTDQTFNVPRLKQEFIKVFCKSNGIYEVMVEYEEIISKSIDKNKFPDLIKIKVNTDNTINIQTIPQPKTSSNKEEVLAFIGKAIASNILKPVVKAEEFVKWFEENF